MRVQEDEFLNLKQGTMTVIEAINKFEQLSRLCPFMVRTEEDKLRRLMDMFRPDIALAIESGGSPPRTVARCVERAIRIEYRMAQVKEEKNMYYEAKRNQRKEGSKSQARTSTGGPNQILSLISLPTSRRKVSRQGKEVREVSFSERIPRIIPRARNVENLIRGNVGLETLTCVTDVGRKVIAQSTVLTLQIMELLNHRTRIRHRRLMRCKHC